MSKLIGAAVTLIFLFFPDELKYGIATGLSNTYKFLIPSLFPYMVISSVFLHTGGVEVVSSLLYKPINKLTGIKKNAVGTYLISLFCGYPTGAKLSSELYHENKISKKEYLKLFCFSNIPGFGFCVSFLGGFYKNGIKIYLSYVITSLIINFILSKNEEEPFLSEEKDHLPFHISITKSVKDASSSMLLIAGYVCFFCSVAAIFKKILKSGLFYSVLCGFLEISMGSHEIYNTIASPLNQHLAVFLTGFSGFSIIFQSLSFSKGEINILSLITARLIFAAVATAVFFIINIF